MENVHYLKTETTPLAQSAELAISANDLVRARLKLRQLTLLLRGYGCEMKCANVFQGV